MGKVTIIKLIWLHEKEATCQSGKLISKNPRKKGGGRGRQKKC